MLGMKVFCFQLGMQNHMCELESCSYMWSQIDKGGKEHRGGSYNYNYRSIIL